MIIDGYYYLHVNGDLIYKRALDGGQVADFRESDLVRMFWPFSIHDRATAWRIVIEAGALGARPDRVDELAGKWQCNDDAVEYAARIGVRLGRDGDQHQATREDFKNLQESPAGFGCTARLAMVELAKELGLRAQKTWGASFEDLVRASR